MRVGKKTQAEALEAARKLGVAEQHGLAGIDSMTRIVQLAKQHHTMQERACNGEMTDAHETRLLNIENEIAERAGALGLKAHFDGDPRGFTVKLHAANGAYNTWGGKETGYGIGDKK